MTTETKKISVKELQTFIEAVEFAADADNWIPSERQWKRIRSMIENLEQSAPVAAPAPAPVQYAQPQQPVYREPQPVRMAPPGMPPPTFNPGQSAHLAAPFANPAAPQVPAKTPDIDTSTSGYTSSFA